MNINLKNKKILITGGLGFIGSNLAQKCLELGAEVSIYDNLDTHSGGNLYNVVGIKDNVNILLYDILNFDLLSQHIANKDYVFNCAASTSHPFSMREPWADMDANVKGTINLLEAIKRFNPQCRFIHIGTSTQLGTLKYQPADENHPEFPTDIYSANKMVSEKYVLVYTRAYGLNASVIRFANIFGPRACINSAEFTFNNFFVGLALQNKTICVFGSGAQKRNVMYVEDAVDALIAAAQKKETIGKSFFAVGDKHISVADIAKITVSVIGSGKVDFIEWPKDREVIEIGDAVISNTEFKKCTDWKPRHELEEGLEKTKSYFKNCLEHYIR
ncbi:MAG: NAD(P)-dependent oxidoreductase [Victivallaceae bacterium]|nr:NAD(P)-dependent oxidoreductase [Victivallaceae bacterium]